MSLTFYFRHRIKYQRQFPASLGSVLTFESSSKWKTIESSLKVGEEFFSFNFLLLSVITTEEHREKTLSHSLTIWTILGQLDWI